MQTLLEYMEQNARTKRELLNLLDNNYVHIVFDKVADGSKRVMFCTRNLDLAREINFTDADMPSGVGKTNPNPYNIAVWDFLVRDGRGGWRSFNINTVYDKKPAPSKAFKLSIKARLAVNKYKKKAKEWLGWK